MQSKISKAWPSLKVPDMSQGGPARRTTFEAGNVTTRKIRFCLHQKIILKSFKATTQRCQLQTIYCGGCRRAAKS